MDSDERDSIFETSRQLADAARLTTLKYFRTQGLTAENKETDGFDPVTQADRECEAAMRAILSNRRPNDGIVGEEFSEVHGTSGLTWVLDPIDGTRGFISGTPTWGVLIGLRTAERVVYGVVDQPYTGERFEGGLGRARHVRGTVERPLVTRETRELSEAILFSTFPEIGTREERKRFDTVAEQVKLVRYGTDCYAYGLVALGAIDLVIEAGLNAYDIAGPLAVVESAGGIVSDWSGGDPSKGGRVIAAATRELHEQALRYLSI